MGSKIEYVDSSHLYATNYVRNSKAIGVLWAIFTICYAIISVVAFVTPEWIGDLETEYPRKFGLWQVCKSDEAIEDCKGRLDEFLSINGLVFKIATVLVGIAVALALFTICAMLLFFFCQSTTVFHICGWLQLLSGKYLLVISHQPTRFQRQRIQTMANDSWEGLSLFLALIKINQFA